MSDKVRPLPKFGEWDVNDPASAEGFTVIFKKARDEKKTGSNARETDSPGKEETAFRNEPYATKPSTVSINEFGWLLARLLKFIDSVAAEEMVLLHASIHQLNLDGRGL